MADAEGGYEAALSREAVARVRPPRISWTSPRAAGKMGATPCSPVRPNMDDAEREHLLGRIKDLERARRRWKVVALATPVLAVLFGIALANAITTSLTLKEVVQRERQAREDAQRAAEEALQQAAEARLREAEQAQLREALDKATRAMEAAERP